MKKNVSLCKNYEFQRAYTKGKSFVGPIVVTYVRKNRLGITQVGITTSKKIGNAVMRNRSRRVIREAFRQLSPRIAPGYDLVFVARGKTPFCKSTRVREQLQKQLFEAGVLQSEQV
ncbi:MAG: ribonuclease P protein component [Acutalibacter sp.]|nr:ribonuclease P protein component [Acutalibacter sp.]